MNRYLVLSGCLVVLLAGCVNNQQDNNVVSVQYVHKYGYAVSKDEFEQRQYPGVVTTALKNGVVITATYENGVLHGLSRHTFPHSKTAEHDFIYKNGVLVKETIYDISGMPVREDTVLSPTRYVSTKWYAAGTPMSTEEYAGKELVEGQYLSILNEVESRVEKGKGVRTVRDLQGVLVSREEIEEGYVVKAETFYPNGTPESIAYFARGVLNGEKKTFNENGEPLSVREYLTGKLHGKTTFYKNGARSVEVHYLDGMKNGLEIHYLDGDMVSQEILWENDKKHGPSKYYIEGVATVEYYYDGDHVSERRWKELNHLDEMIGQISPDVAW